MKLIVPLFAMVWAGAALGAELQKYPLKPQDRVSLSLAKAQVSIAPIAGDSLSLNWGANCRDILNESEDGQVNLQQKEMLKPRGEEGPCVLQVGLPAGRALNLHVLEGSISSAKTNGEMILHLQKGKVNVREGQGLIALHVQRGEIAVTDFQGRVRMDLLNVASSIKNLNGDLEVQALGGDHVVDKPKGNLRLMQAQGSFKVIGGQGSLQVETVRSSVTTQAFAGRIEGQTQEGNMSLALTSEPDVNLRSQGKDSRITLSVPGGSGAAVNISSQEGEVYGPSTMSVARVGASKILRGRLRGEAKGSVVVHSQEGSIILK